MTKRVSLLAVFGLICLVTLPTFFDGYRIAIFHTMPRDDYAPFLLHFTSGKGVWPGSPHGYRLFSILPAALLYWILPVYKFSQLGEIDPSYLRATQALAFMSFLAVAGSATVAYALVRRKLGRNDTQAALATTLTVVLARYGGGFGGVDPTAIFVIFLLCYYLDRPAVFGPIFLLTPFINEKILFFFLFLALARSLFVRGFFRTHAVQIASVTAGLGLYAAALTVIHLPGNPGQLDIHRRIPEIILVWRTSSASLKGLVLNFLPPLLFTLPCVLWSTLGDDSEVLFRPDCLVPVGLFVVGLSLTRGYEVGRVVAYAVPLTVLSVVSLLERRGTEQVPIAHPIPPDGAARDAIVRPRARASGAEVALNA